MMLIHMVLYWLEDANNKIVLEPRLKVVSSIKEGVDIQNTLSYLGFKTKFISEEIKDIGD